MKCLTEVYGESAVALKVKAERRNFVLSNKD